MLLCLLIASQFFASVAYGDTWTIFAMPKGDALKVEAESLEVTSGGALIFTNTINGTKKIMKIFSPRSYAYVERHF